MHRHILCLSESIHVKDNRHKEEQNVTKGRKKGISLPKSCELANFGKPRVDQWISLQASAHSGGGRGGAGSAG